MTGQNCARDSAGRINSRMKKRIAAAARKPRFNDDAVGFMVFYVVLTNVRKRGSVSKLKCHAILQRVAEISKSFPVCRVCNQKIPNAVILPGDLAEFRKQYVFYLSFLSLQKLVTDEKTSRSPCCNRILQ